MTPSVAAGKARRFRQREQDLLWAATRAFREAGDWRIVSIDTVARQAGVAKGTFYLHFRSREELHAALVIEMAKRLAGRLHKASRDATLPGDAFALAARAAAAFRAEAPLWDALAGPCLQSGAVAVLSESRRAAFVTAFAALAARIGEFARAWPPEAIPIPAAHAAWWSLAGSPLPEFARELPPSPEREALLGFVAGQHTQKLNSHNMTSSHI